MSIIPSPTLLTRELFDLSHTRARTYLEETVYPWEILPRIRHAIREIGTSLDARDYHHPSPTVWIAKTASVAPTAYLGEWIIIGERTEVRHGAFLRGNALVGDGCVVGNSTELKNCMLFDGAQVPHYNYVGDSVLGYRSHMGAGSITSNVKGDKTPVFIKPLPHTEDGFDPIPTGLTKCGGFLGDLAEVGCGSVLNPGTVLGRHTRVYPLVSVRGVLPPHTILKASDAPFPARPSNE